ncbi:STAS domain-containing protein [Blastococcus sp. SYSU DS0616]
MGPHDIALPAPEGGPFLLSVDPSAARVTVHGELDREHAHLVLDALATLSVADGTRWTLDAGGVTFCDAEGLRVLLSAHCLARGRGAQLEVLPSPCVHRLVILVGLDQLLETPPPPPAVSADVAETRRTRRSLAAVRDPNRRRSTPDRTPFVS